MIDYKGKVAVITGAASGLGRGIAVACAARGMKLALADIQESMLKNVADELREKGSEVMALAANVAEVDDMERFAHHVYKHFGEAYFLFNNAGVLGKSSTLDATLKDWEWIIGVNLWGVIHGIRAFVPRMLESGKDGHVINISGHAGFLSSPGSSIYRMTKHAVVSLSESLYHELSISGSKIKVSVVSPAFIKTSIMEAEKKRPARLQNSCDQQLANPYEEAVLGFFNQYVQNGPEPEAVADVIFKGIDNQKFYIFSPSLSEDLITCQAIQQRLEDILAEKNPDNPFTGTSYKLNQAEVDNRGCDVTIIPDATTTMTKKSSHEILAMYSKDNITVMPTDEFLQLKKQPSEEGEDEKE